MSKKNIINKENKNNKKKRLALSLSIASLLLFSIGSVKAESSFTAPPERTSLESAIDLYLEGAAPIFNLPAPPIIVPPTPTGFPAQAPAPEVALPADCSGCPATDAYNKAIQTACDAEGSIVEADRDSNDSACDQEQIVDEFRAGTPAETLVTNMTSNIETYSEMAQDQLSNNTVDIVGRIDELSLNLQDGLARFQTRINQAKLERDEHLNDKRMDYMAEIKEREVRTRKSEFSMDDTAEEIAFIEHQLEQAETEKTQEVIFEMKNKYDANPNFVIPIQIKSSKRFTDSASGESCESYDPSTDGLQNGCFYYQKVNPGKKLESIFNECSRAKRNQMASLQQKATAEVVNNELKKEQSRVANQVVSGSDRYNRQSNMRKTNCNFRELGANLCGFEDVEPSDYVSKVVDNEIIPNGHVSAANLFSPSAIGSYDGDTNLSGEQLKGAAISASEKGEEAVSGNTPNLINTYKTSSQYLAAKDYIETLLNRPAASNQPIVRREQSGSSEFQSRYMQRNAALSLSEKVLNSIIEKRVGTRMSSELSSNGLSRDELINEDVNGAGFLDSLEDTVKKDYSKIVVSATGSQTTTEELSRMAPKNIKNWQYEAQVLNTKLQLENRMSGEEIELLLATYVSQSTNSASNIDFLEQMKMER